MHKQKSVKRKSLKRACRHLDERSKEHLKDVRYQDPFRESVALVNELYFPPEYRGGIDSEKAFLKYGKEHSRDNQGRLRESVAAHFTLSPPDEISALIMALEDDEKQQLLLELKEFYDTELSKKFYDAPRGISIHTGTIRPHFEAIVMMYHPDNKQNGGFWHVHDGRTDSSAEAALAAIHSGKYWKESFHCKLSYEFTQFAAKRLREIYRHHNLRNRKAYESSENHSEAFFKRFNAAWEYFGFLKVATTSQTLIWQKHFREKVNVKIPGAAEAPLVESYERLKSVIGPDCQVPEVGIEPTRLARLARSRAARILIRRRQEPPWISLMWRDARLDLIACIRQLRKIPPKIKKDDADKENENLTHEIIFSVFQQFNFVDRWEDFEQKEPAFLKLPSVFHLDKAWPKEVMDCMRVEESDIETLFFDPAIALASEAFPENANVPSGLRQLIVRKFPKPIYHVDGSSSIRSGFVAHTDPTPADQTNTPPIAGIESKVPPPDMGLEI